VLAGAFAWAASSMMLFVLSVDSGGTHAVDPNTITSGRLGIGACRTRHCFSGPHCAGKLLVSRAIGSPAVDGLGDFAALHG
jgi:hypothetical protein